MSWTWCDATENKSPTSRFAGLFFFNYAWIDSLSLSPLVSSLVSLSVCLSLPLSSLSFLYPLSPLHPRSTPLTLLICFVSRNESSFTKIDWIQPDWRGRRNESPSRPVAQSLTDWPGPLTRHLLLLLLFAIISGYFESWFLSRTNSDWPISLSPLPRSEIVTVKEKPARRGYRWLPRLVNFKWIPFTTRTQKIIDFLFLNDKGKMKGRKEGRKEGKEGKEGQSQNKTIFCRGINQLIDVFCRQQTFHGSVKSRFENRYFFFFAVMNQLVLRCIFFFIAKREKKET